MGFYQALASVSHIATEEMLSVARTLTFEKLFVRHFVRTFEGEMSRTVVPVQEKYL